MKIRAVIFDVYQTLLEVGPPPPDADEQWRWLCQQQLHMTQPMARAEFSAACGTVVVRHHEIARSRGIAWPEVCWPAVVGEVIPALRKLSPADQDQFLYRLALISRTVRISTPTAEMLRWLSQQRLVLGIASNAQAYTLQELAVELAAHKLGLALFDPQLRAWSFELGFSKPNPHVFQILTARLASRGIDPAEILMVGDRLDNDIEPARAHGWQAWQLDPLARDNWAGLRRQLPCTQTNI